MAVIDVINQNGEVVGTYDLNDTVFGIEPHKDALYEAVKLQRASLRQGTSAVKRRSDVRGGGRKPYRQKGTGRARQGSIRAPSVQRRWSCIWSNPETTLTRSIRKYAVWL